MLHSVEGPALLSSEVCRAVTGGGAAGLEPQSVPGTVEAAPGRGREVTVSHCPPHPATTRPGAGAPAGPGSPGPVLPGSDLVAGHTLRPQAPPLPPAGRAVSPGHVLGLTASLLPPGGRAPQPGAGRHVGAGGGARPEHQGTLGCRVEIFPRQLGHLGANVQLVVPGLVPQTLSEPSTEQTRITD